VLAAHGQTVILLLPSTASPRSNVQKAGLASSILASTIVARGHESRCHRHDCEPWQLVCATDTRNNYRYPF